MIWNRRKVYVRGIVFALVSVALAAQADISYIPVPAGASNGFVEVSDPGNPNSGTARIEYNYWLDESSGYWHYAYQVFNDDYNNNATPTDRDNDYHFGYEYDGDPLFVNSIHKFDLVFDPASGINDLVVVGRAGSTFTSGGTGWGESKDLIDIFHPELGYSGLDWTVTLGGAGAQPIYPTQWNDYGKNNKPPDWRLDYAGDASTDDSNGQYFQIASKWAPGWVGSSVVTGVSQTASGQVIGPSIIPEPATFIMFAIGALGLIRGRRYWGVATVNS